MKTCTSPHDLPFDELQARIAGWGQPAFRARQVWDGLYRRLSAGYDAMTSLPQVLRQRLAEELPLPVLAPVADQRSGDGWTRKILFALADGTRIETVLMRYRRRRTLCLSTQAGCAMGCPFCATGQGGLRRNLAPGEIVEQVLWFERLLRTAGEPGDAVPGRGLTNIVFMGMGEPFSNYQATIAALRRLSDARGLGFGARRITVSTVGLIPGIRRFTVDGGQVNLAVSIHAGTDELRDRLVPINTRFPLRELMAACGEYVQATRRRLSFEWALIDGVNDGPEQAEAFARLAAALPRHLVHANLIPLNPTRGYQGSASRRQRIAAFRAVLDRFGVASTLRVRRGIDIAAGCGQLADDPAPGSASPVAIRAC